mgnify:CR=1 FL=1
MTHQISSGDSESEPPPSSTGVPSILLLAARETARKPVRSLEKYIQLLDELAAQKLFDAESVKKYLKQSKKPAPQKKTSAHQYDERDKSDYEGVIIDL